MNRLILIGNGFDLNHQLKTSYTDFLSWLIFGFLSKKENVATEDNIPVFQIDISDEDSAFDRIIRDLSIYNAISKYNELKESQNKCRFSLDINCSIILRSILLNQSNWLDIEHQYFSLIRKMIGKVKTHERIAALNSQFEFLRSKLFEYLGTINIEVEQFDPNVYTKHFSQNFIKEDFLNFQPPRESPDNFHIINFNYTSLFEKVYSFGGWHDKTLYIHGRLGNDKQEPVFGFGDENNEEMGEIDKYNNNAFYKNLKTILYSENENYFKLMNILEEDIYQVFIYGHGCGVSDRTLLKEIFEHRHCLSIKQFYYKDEKGNTDFKERTTQIYRHFKNKAEFRKKMVPLNLSEELPLPFKTK